MGEAERSAVCWRFGSDREMISHDKKIMSLSDYFHLISATKGVADMRLLNHHLQQKNYEQVVAAPVFFPADCSFKFTFVSTLLLVLQ